MEHTSDLVYEGNMIHENSYPQRSSKYEEIEIDGIKVDFYNPKDKVIHEIKKSNKIEQAHEWQLKYYIYVFEQNGIIGVNGILEYPLLRKKESIILTDIDREIIENMKKEIIEISESDICPLIEKKNICKQCSYFEFCYIGEEEI